MLHERVLAWRAANILQPLETNLRNNSTKLATRRRDTVSSRPITCWEGFTGNDKRRRVRPEVLEEVGETVEDDETVSGSVGRCETIVTEAHCSEKDRKDAESHELDGLASP